MSLYSTEFDRFETDVVGAFIRFFSRFLEIFENLEFSFEDLIGKFAACEPKLFKKKQKVTNYYELYQLLYNTQLCNWFNFKLVEDIAVLYKEKVPKANTFTLEYKSYLYPKKLKDVSSYLKKEGIERSHFEKIKFHLNKDPNTYTVRDAKNLLDFLKTKCAQARLIGIRLNCIQMECIVPKTSSFKTKIKKISVALRNLHIYCVSIGDDKTFSVILDERNYPLEDYTGKCKTVCN